MYNGMELSSGRMCDRAKIKSEHAVRTSAFDAQVSLATT
jgi:hypothetical protein